MAWMLCEELMRLVLGALFALFLKGIKGLFMSEIRRCMIKACGGVAAKQGLCLKCYGQAKKKVEAGQTTWEQLEKMGLCESVADPFNDAYNRALEDN